ncbi:MAG: M3 family metallopeptidase, partial [Bacteroidales bacterium]
MKMLFKITFLFLLTSCTMTKNNPLLETPGNTYQAPPFDRIELSDYKPALIRAIDSAKSRVDSITANQEPPTFTNTIEALEYAGEEVSRIAMIFYNLNEAHTSDQMQKLAQELSPLYTEYQLYVSLNPALFERVKEVYPDRSSPELTQEQARLLEETYKGFVRNGANLPPEDKKTYGAIQEQLSVASLKFSSNVLSATNAYTLHLALEEDLEGLPAYMKEMGKEAAAAQKKDGWVFTLDYPSYGGFLKFSTRRELREQMWKAYNSRCLEEYGNQDLIQEIVSLRLQSANLLGYDKYSDYALEQRMAKKPETVNGFLQDLMQKTLPYARREVAEIQQYARSMGFKGLLMPWDFSFWSEKYREEKFDLSEEMLKPYFSLDKVQKAVFSLAGTLYGLQFKPAPEVPVYHPDVKVFEVTGEDGRFTALLYVDYYPRRSKRSGAWMTSYREQHKQNGKEYRPLVSLVTNFTKPTATSPSLLTFSEVTTLFHEFGHCLHGMLAEGSYASLTGTSVARDFVELPSQILENWAYEPEFLKTFAVHYQTGDPIPEEMINKIVASKNYLAGFGQVRQLQYSILDMAWHDSDRVPSMGIPKFE